VNDLATGYPQAARLQRNEGRTPEQYHMR